MPTNKTLLRMGALLAFSGAVVSQNEPSFSLSSSATFGTGENPKISLSSSNVDLLEFRVYRVKDPVKFFQQLRNAHNFGERSQPAVREVAMIEWLRRWKRGLRASIRRGLRTQFTESPRRAMANLFAPQRPAEPPTPAPGRETRYAQAPLLNSEQLVMSFQHRPAAKNRWEYATVDVPVSDRGLYLVEAVHKDRKAYTILLVTGMVMITKNSGGRVMNFVVDRRTGEPLEGVSVNLVKFGGSLGESSSDKDGMAEMKVAEAVSGGVRVVARHGNDTAVNAIEEWSLRQDREEWKGYVYTDRPIYRPGHKVRFRGVVRRLTDSGYTVPAGAGLQVSIQDSSGKRVLEKNYTASLNGTIHGELELAASAALGYYQIQVRSGESYMSGSFEVEAYKKPEYEVKVTPEKPRILQGEMMRATIDSRYYFGEPVSKAKVKYAIYRQRHWGYWDQEEEDGEEDPEQQSFWGRDQVGMEEGELDADGKLTVTIPAPVSEEKHDHLYSVEARVTDAGNREVSGIGWFVASYASLRLHAIADRYVYSPDAKASFRVEARGQDGSPVAARFRAELYKVSYRRRQEMSLQDAVEGATGTDGIGNVNFTTPKEGGNYLLKVKARAPEGREVEGQSWIWVTGDWVDGGSRQSTLTMAPDQKTYRAGQTARVLIVTGRPNTAVYLTVEGRNVTEQRVIRVKESSFTHEVPVRASDEPGIILNAAFVHDGVLHQQTRYIRVPPVEHELKVKLSTDKPDYQPGQPGEYTMEVSDHTGQPVAGAEFSLGVVDEAIYGIRRDPAEDILKYFFGRRWNQVNTKSSLSYYFHGGMGVEAMSLAFSRNEIAGRSALAQLKPERMVLPKVRQAFPDTAYWSANLVTDASGRARAKVEFPDSLTTWRATARGVTRDTRAGSGVLKTMVRKNLILRLAVPRFFVQGDEVVISAIVHNYLASPKKVKVSLELQGLEALEGSAREVEVPSRGESKRDWRVRARQVKKVVITGKALTNEESDALELELPVNLPGVKLSEARGGSLKPGESASLEMSFPPSAYPGSRTLRIEVTPSIAGSLFSAVEYLTSFPYGCVEQTMSSFLPNITVKRAVKELGLPVNLDEPSLHEKINAGMERLNAFQHKDGGWGWWETDESHPFMTAYVLAGLVQAKAAGIRVNEYNMEKAAGWIEKNLDTGRPLKLDLRGYMVYALTLAKQNPGKHIEQVYERKSRLSPYGLAMLGLALDAVKDTRAVEVAGLVEQAAKQDQEQAWWPGERDEMLDFDGDVTPEATAFAAKLLARQRSGSPLLPKAALWLMNHRNQGYWWSSTKQTAMVIFGLTDYLKVTGELKPDLTASVHVNDRQAVSRRMTQATVLDFPVTVLEEANLERGANRIRITAAGQGRLYYSVRAEHHSTDQKLQRTGSGSLNLLRDYYRLTPSRQGEKIVYDMAPLEGAVAVGDIVAVRLTLTGQQWRYLMVEDPIPAGTEFIAADHGYELRNKPPWWAYYFTRREQHDDRMAIFDTFFPAGQKQYFYLLKVVNPGVFQVSPARVGPMYQTNVMATTESRKVEAK